ncbi:MAG: peptide chain release factor N(5)-glutamine methyltransferase [Oscillospiraceae bacterium]|nr:peptide chain release factor N(5)-glutamine methyltransferase [Oscillospiraceae bacterium]
MVKKYSEVFVEASRAIAATEDAQTANLYAKNLLCKESGLTYENLLAQRDMYASQEVCDAMDRAVRRIQRGEPLAYVLGEWDFYGMTLTVDRNVLIPRDDTCAVASLAINQALFLDAAPRILDLCTGSGCIGLAVANRVTDARVTLADYSREALAVARTNIKNQKLTARVSCVHVNALEPAPAFLGTFDLIVSNPPYVTTEEMAQLDDSVKDYEPHMALHGGDDGLEFYRAIAENYKTALKPGGYLCFEFGMGQGDDVCAILEKNEYRILDRTKDYNGVERAVIAQYGRKEV